MIFSKIQPICFFSSSFHSTFESLSIGLFRLVLFLFANCFKSAEFGVFAAHSLGDFSNWCAYRVAAVQNEGRGTRSSCSSELDFCYTSPASVNWACNFPTTLYCDRSVSVAVENAHCENEGGLKETFLKVRKFGHHFKQKKGEFVQGCGERIRNPGKVFVNFPHSASHLRLLLLFLLPLLRRSFVTKISD